MDSNAKKTDLLRHHISKMVALTDQDFDLIDSQFKHKVVRKHQYLLQEGEVCRREYYVLSGALRQYYVHNGKERITQFGFEDYWISDWYSMLNQTPSRFNIDALESSEVLEIKKESLDLLFEQVPMFERFFRITFQRAFAAQQQRISYMQKSARERYEEFVKLYGHFQHKVSQEQIASFMGITRESLSRIRSQYVSKKK